METILLSYLTKWRMIDRYRERGLSRQSIARIAQHASFGLEFFERSCGASIGNRDLRLIR